MTRPRTLPACTAFAALGTVVLFAWCVASAFSPPDAGSAESGASPTPAEPSRPAARARRPGVLAASTTQPGGPLAFGPPRSSVLASTLVPRASAASGGAVSSRPRAEEAGEVRSRPAVAEAPSDSSIPPSAMSCTVSDGVPTCGDCRTDSDCPAEQGCVVNRRTRRFECLASECEVDAHCFPGTLCRAVNDGASGEQVRRCVPEGLREEGERCLTLPVGPEDTCREGLLCVQQLCGRPCQKEVSGSCPSGQRCVDSLNGSACYPDCRTAGCAQGETCERLREDTYQCLEAVTGTCNETPCAEGERCNLRMAQGRAAFWCAPRCNPLHADTCPGGQVCGRGGPTDSTCFQRCEPMAADTCGPGWRCTSVSEDMTLWGCVPVP